MQTEAETVRILCQALEVADRALDHDVPSSCWATGPLTGDPIQDLVVCPGCVARTAIARALRKARGEV